MIGCCERAEPAAKTNTLKDALSSHLKGDWGDVTSRHKAANNLALKEGGSLRSVYRSRGIHFQVETGADRYETPCAGSDPSEKPAFGRVFSCSCEERLMSHQPFASW